MKAALSVVGAVFFGGIVALIALLIGHRMPVEDDENIHGGSV